MMDVFTRHVGPRAVATDHQPPVHQQVDGFADGHARHPELLGQFFLSRQRAADGEVGRIQPQPQAVSNGFVDHQ